MNVAMRKGAEVGRIAVSFRSRLVGDTRGVRVNQNYQSKAALLTRSTAAQSNPTYCP